MYFTRRQMLIATAVVSGELALAGCGSGGIDPQKILDLLKQGCGIAIPIATITAIINASVGMAAQAIVDLICSAYKSQLAAQGKLGADGKPTTKSGETTKFIVHVGGKDIEVEATTQ